MDYDRNEAEEALNISSYVAMVIFSIHLTFSFTYTGVSGSRRDPGELGLDDVSVYT